MSDNQTPDHEKEIDDHSGIETTGHEWDGIKELNNPLPRWWLIIFYATIAWAFVYWIFMPSFPGLTGHLKGVRNHSERVNVTEAVDAMRAERAALGQQLLASTSLEDIENNPDLFQFAREAGRSAFGDNCATCHGPGGSGFAGYPNLNDDVWLWGGTLEDIRFTLTHGIRSVSDQTRYSLMPAYGADGLLQGDQINDLTEYVWHLAGNDANEEMVARAEPIYQAQCAACHQADGTGDRSQGAPNLTDAEWLYGGSKRAITAQIYGGRNGVMPGWGDRLDEATIAALAVYVHTLGGGEEAPVKAASPATEYSTAE